MTIIFAGLILALVALASLLLIAAASRHQKASATKFDVVGRLASVEKELCPEGTIIVRGEVWPARARDGGSVGRGRLNVRVVGASRHLLEVEPVVEANLSEGGLKN